MLSTIHANLNGSEVSATQRARGERVVVLGARVDGVDSHSWDAIPPSLNLANYSTAIYYLPSLQDLIDEWRESPEARDLFKVDAPQWPGFSVAKRQVYRQMISDGTRVAVFVGDPETPVYGLGNSAISTTLFPWFPFIYRDENQVRSVVDDHPASRYLQAIDRTSYTLGRRRGDTADSPTDPLDAIAEAAEAHAVGTRSVHVLADGMGGAAAVALGATVVDPEHEAQVLHALWLPAPTKLATEDALALLLRDLCAVECRPQPPEWAAESRLPAEATHRLRLEALANEQAILSAETLKTQAAIEDVREFLPLLWSTGAVLEDLVRRALRFLEATVHDPSSKGEEDGILTDPDGGKWVLEIKGNEGSIKQKDVTDAHKHETEVLDRTGGDFDGRALLVVNAERLRLPESRQQFVPENVERLARNWSVAILFAEDLLEAVSQKQIGAFNSDLFWERVRSADVVVDCPMGEVSS